jgi:hypothetical protein
VNSSEYFISFLVPDDSFKVTSGAPQSISKTTDGGKETTSYFCGDCGSTLYHDGVGFPGMKIVKAGILDDFALPEGKPNNRVAPVAEMDGAAQKDAIE